MSLFILLLRPACLSAYKIHASHAGDVILSHTAEGDKRTKRQMDGLSIYGCLDIYVCKLVGDLEEKVLEKSPSENGKYLRINVVFKWRKVW